MHTHQSARAKLGTLEIGRGLAALLVCLYHYIGYSYAYFGEYGALEWLRGGNAGVQYFFVLSGFIMLWIHQKDFGEKARTRRFFEKRFIRLYPIFWCIIIPMTAAILLVPSLGADKALSPTSVLFDLFMLPHHGDLILPPVWTLHRELLFYVLFSLAIAFGRKGLYVIVAWQIACLVAFLHGDFVSSYWRELVLGVHNLGFGLGMWVAYLVRTKACSHTAAWGYTLMGLGGFFALFLLQGALEAHFGQEGFKVVQFSKSWIVFYTLFAGVSVFGLVNLEQKLTFKIPRWLYVFGGTSYVLYLVHEPAGSVFYKIMTLPYFANTFDYLNAFWLAGLGAVFSAVILHLWLEKPLLARLNGKKMLLPSGSHHLGHRSGKKKPA